jgi:hypothetical protein
MQAPGSVIGHLRPNVLGFGAGTPLAPQGAALEKDDGPNAGTVVNCKSLDLEKSTEWIHHQTLILLTHPHVQFCRRQN